MNNIGSNEVRQMEPNKAFEKLLDAGAAIAVRAYVAKCEKENTPQAESDALLQPLREVLIEAFDEVRGMPLGNVGMERVEGSLIRATFAEAGLKLYERMKVDA